MSIDFENILFALPGKRPENFELILNSHSLKLVNLKQHQHK